ncbi:inorganic pyrophosphatase [Metamycoplasma subdolum]|uniref:Inorganic pyrophosphatase n=1 Tax=Metamycoplasma subdolum TaxID=92407 RepID=A0A3M0A845_9BACT|nr:inorganic diphosphatase [Metamycoplasma subdolum]RMA78645.1 inorganic pyrophosphatase [Metamycoplasma subdolum]WPB50753.1 inorganic diphosphatase [Metamycoplasma subdolum]
MKNIEVNIEISKGSNIKYEYDRATGKIKVDRILRGEYKYPANYGYIQEALDWDGDELDVLVYSPETFIPGVSLNARVIGAMKMIDSGETDTKLIAVHADDARLENIKSLADVDKMWLKSIEVFFSTYKAYKGENVTKVTGFEDIKWAEKEYLECVNLMNKYGKMDKKDFVKKMQKEHPEKYV